MAASIPYEDFDVNAVGTLNVVVAARDFCRDFPVCFTSTNKLNGDTPNRLSLIEKEKRYDYGDPRDGIDETMSIDGSLHSVFGHRRLLLMSCVRSLVVTSRCQPESSGADA